MPAHSGIRDFRIATKADLTYRLVAWAVGASSLVVNPDPAFAVAVVTFAETALRGLKLANLNSARPASPAASRSALTATPPRVDVGSAPRGARRSSPR